jgi:hypothetical protein
MVTTRYGQHPDRKTRLREQTTIRRICTLAANGHTPGSIAAILNPTRTRSGKPWARSTVLKIIMDNPRIMKRESAKVAAQDAERRKDTDYVAQLVEWGNAIETPEWLKPYEQALSAFERATAIRRGYVTANVDEWDKDAGRYRLAETLVASDAEYDAATEHVQIRRPKTQ